MKNKLEGRVSNGSIDDRPLRPPVQAQKMVELGSRCGECGAGLIRLTEKQRKSLKVAIAALRSEGFEVQLVRMFQAEPVMMAMMISKAKDG